MKIINPGGDIVVVHYKVLLTYKQKKLDSVTVMFKWDLMGSVKNSPIARVGKL